MLRYRDMLTFLINLRSKYAFLRNSIWYRYLFTNFHFKYIWHLFLFLYYYMNEQKVHFQNCKQAYQISYALSTVSFYSYRSICYCSIWCQKLWKLASRIWISSIICIICTSVNPICIYAYLKISHLTKTKSNTLLSLVKDV